MLKVADLPSVFVTWTETVPVEAAAGTTAVTCVAETTLTFVAAVVPKRTVSPGRKFVPVRVTVFPPVRTPEFGEIPVSVGGGVETYVKAALNWALCVSGFVTCTATTPVPGGVTAVTCVELTTTVLAALLLPKRATAPAANPDPVIVTVVPPPVVPEVGDTLEIVGMASGVYVNAFRSVLLCESGFVTCTLTGPGAMAGVDAVIVVLFTTVTAVARVLPNRTVAPPWKSVPVMVTLVPPSELPDEGATFVTVGAGPR